MSSFDSMSFGRVQLS